MNQNNSCRKEFPKLSDAFIYTKIMGWGLETGKIPKFQTMREEIKHFGKPVKSFTKHEKQIYDTIMEALIEHFRMFPRD